MLIFEITTIPPRSGVYSLNWENSRKTSSMIIMFSNISYKYTHILMISDHTMVLPSFSSLADTLTPTVLKLYSGIIIDHLLYLVVGKHQAPRPATAGYPKPGALPPAQSRKWILPSSLFCAPDRTTAGRGTNQPHEFP